MKRKRLDPKISKISLDVPKLPVSDDEMKTAALLAAVFYLMVS
jgi:hypothetical protein